MNSSTTPNMKNMPITIGATPIGKASHSVSLRIKKTKATRILRKPVTKPTRAASRIGTTEWLMMPSIARS